MSVAGFEPTNSVFGQAKTVHALDRGANLIVSCATLHIPSVITPHGGFCDV
jgi:hypothetical protein